MDRDELQNKFLAICKQRIHEPRAAERATAEIMVRMVDGWIPDVMALEGAAICRAGYLLSLCVSWASCDQIRAKAGRLVKQLEGMRPLEEGATFYHGDRDQSRYKSHDQLASKWLLKYGGRPSDLRNQMTSYRLKGDS